ncbi:MAG: YHS domain-containing (seleno)protein [Cyclobacteriaceae bacterium]
MKNLVKSILVVSAILVSTLTYAQDKKAYNIDDSKIALQGYSPVSYLDLGIAQVGLKEYKASYNGLNYYFTSQDQKKKFEANPTKYLPQYGGFCAFGVSVGAKFRVDPNKFLVKDGKYFLFLYDLEVDAQQLWLAGKHKDLLSTADTNWNKLSTQP